MSEPTRVCHDPDPDAPPEPDTVFATHGLDPDITWTGVKVHDDVLAWFDGWDGNGSQRALRWADNASITDWTMVTVAAGEILRETAVGTPAKSTWKRVNQTTVTGAGFLVVAVHAVDPNRRWAGVRLHGSIAAWFSADKEDDATKLAAAWARDNLAPDVGWTMVLMVDGVIAGEMKVTRP